MPNLIAVGQTVQAYV